MRGKNCTTRNKNNRVRVQRRKGGGAGGHRLSSFSGRQVQPIRRDFPPASVARGRDDTVESACLLEKTFGVPNRSAETADATTRSGRCGKYSGTGYASTSIPGQVSASFLIGVLRPPRRSRKPLLFVPQRLHRIESRGEIRRDQRGD